MGTASTISCELANGNVISIDCTYDGDITGVGKLLKQCYNTPEKAIELIKMGNVSQLGRVIGEKHPFDMFDLDSTDPNFRAIVELSQRAKSENWSKFYTRDREDLGEQMIKYDSYEDFLDDDSGAQKFNYILLQSGEWFVAKNTFYNPTCY